jgi:hypothetical protein
MAVCWQRRPQERVIVWRNTKRPPPTKTRSKSAMELFTDVSTSKISTIRNFAERFRVVLFLCRKTKHTVVYHSMQTQCDLFKMSRTLQGWVTLHIKDGKKDALQKKILSKEWPVAFSDRYSSRLSLRQSPWRRRQYRPSKLRNKLVILHNVNPLNTKRRLLYLNTQFVAQ